jgi:hypothetical protein
MSPNVSGARRSAAAGLQKCYTQYFEEMAQNVSRFFCTRKKSGPRSDSDEACTGCCVQFQIYSAPIIESENTSRLLLEITIPIIIKPRIANIAIELINISSITTVQNNSPRIQMKTD